MAEPTPSLADHLHRTVNLDDADALDRLRAHDHGVLCTSHPERGVDAVPVVYAVDDDGHVGIPVDTVKPKRPGRLQRERNLAADPRATLLVEHWDRDDWTKLWWVRVELRQVEHSGDEQLDRNRAEALAGLLAARYPQYRNRPFARVLVLRVTGVAGWAAAG